VGGDVVENEAGGGESAFSSSLLNYEVMSVSLEPSMKPDRIQIRTSFLIIAQHHLLLISGGLNIVANAS
jgi:hypothetical protein